MLGHAKDEFFDEKNLNSGIGTEDSFTAYGYVCFSLIKFKKKSNKIKTSLIWEQALYLWYYDKRAALGKILWLW